MFERYTEAARRALFFARYEVTQLGARSIETEHLLLGLIREPEGLVARIFVESNVSPATLRQAIEGRIEVGESIPTSVEIPFSAETKRVLQYAAAEADGLTHSYIGTEHLLLGVLREEASVAASILNANNIRLQGVRDAIVGMLRAAPTVPDAPLANEAAFFYRDTDIGVRTFERIALIKRLVQDLARLAPDSSEARALSRGIESSLDALIRHLGG